MTTDASAPAPTGATPPPVPQHKWRPLSRLQRRVVGVLVEKAKTTPDTYPMTLNAITVGCNQKTNRAPLMHLTADEVETTLEELRRLGAVVEVQGGGRVAKFRHQMYEWLGVDKVELAVMAELLLRGEQTVGELRARAARMEPIPGLNELQPVLQSLIDKKLVLPLTPPGRGQLVSHGLYSPRELEDLKARVLGAGAAPASDESAPAGDGVASGDEGGVSEAVEALRVELAELREQVAELRQRVEHFERALQ